MRKKFPKDPKYTKIALYVFLTVGALMILWQLVTSSSNLWVSFKQGLDFVWSSIRTVVIGLILGYIMSPGVAFLEKWINKIFNKKHNLKKERRIRIISIALLFVILIVIIVLMIIYIIPPLVSNIVQFSDSLPDYIDQAIKWYNENLKDSSLFTSEYTKGIIDDSTNVVMDRINEIALTIVTALATSVFSAVSGIVRFVIAFVIAFYFLLSEKAVVQGVSEFGRLRLGEERSKSVSTFIRSVDWVFGKYISAKLLQIFILFILAQVLFLIIGVQLSTLMAFILAVANVIPYVGGFIGMIPPILLSLLESPMKAVWVFLAAQLIQLIDNYIIGPFMIGDKMGLSPFWSLVVVIIGGNLFGFLGVLLSIPVAAVIRILIRRYISSQKRKLEMEAKVK